ncbi:exported protein [Candidatus Thiomargarita nelsonii]|uniref:Exported protein n=1 Tax=Candidatus Thiomargarita nelsonii TaxID=1003181 RepID=A0A0A6RJG2_9GAMM|nr:exported protein [Candidatus Thiomargarita nelsonii]
MIEVISTLSRERRYEFNSIPIKESTAYFAWVRPITSLKDIQPPTLQQKVVEKLRSYLFYEKDWDGYGGVVPSEKAVEDAVDFIRKLPEKVVLPRPGLAGDGEVGLFWKLEVLFIDVGFLGDHTYSFYARDAEGKEYYGDDIPLNEDLPVGLINTIPTTVEI